MTSDVKNKQKTIKRRGARHKGRKRLAFQTEGQWRGRAMGGTDCCLRPAVKKRLCRTKKGLWGRGGRSWQGEGLVSWSGWERKKIGIKSSKKKNEKKWRARFSPVAETVTTQELVWHNARSSGRYAILEGEEESGKGSI